MRIPRIYTDQPLTSHSRIALEPEPSRHLAQVLRLSIGAQLHLFNGTGEEYAASIAELGNKQVLVDTAQRVRNESSPTLRIHLMLGISRGERMEYALQKAVELGVSELQPLFTERCMVKLTGKRLTQRLAHWRSLIVNACEQSGRCRIPALFDPLPLAAALRSDRPGVSLLLDPRSRQTLLDLPKPAMTVTLLVGPEGGLSDTERALATGHGFIGISLGPRILRTETAPLAAIAALQTLWGDFR